MEDAPKPSRAKQPKSTLYVGGLEETVSEEVLHAAFVPFGDIAEVHIPKNWEKGENRGFGFVQFEEEDDAAAAFENMDGAELHGRVLKVNVARPMKHKLGAGKAVWTAEDWFQNMNEGDDILNMGEEPDDGGERQDSLQPAGA